MNNKPGPLRPDPLIDVPVSITQPDEIYQTYLGKFSGSMRSVKMLSVPACIFELVLPALIGLLVDTVK